MSQASILPTRGADPFAAPARTSEPSRVGATPSAPDLGRNYLPGLRPVSDDLAAYFKDKFVWLNC